MPRTFHLKEIIAHAMTTRETPFSASPTKRLEVRSGMNVPDAAIWQAALQSDIVTNPARPKRAHLRTY